MIDSSSNRSIEMSSHSVDNNAASTLKGGNKAHRNLVPGEKHLKPQKSFLF